MLKKYIKSSLSRFLQNIKLKKQYVSKLQSKISSLRSNNKQESYKHTNSFIGSKDKSLLYEDSFVMYVINITFSRTNTLLNVMDFSGKQKFFGSAGLVKYTGKSKRARFSVFRDLYRSMLVKLKSLGSKPIALHLKNVGSHKFWLVEKLKKKFYLKVIKDFNSYPYNGCRKKKAKHKKF